MTVHRATRLFLFAPLFAALVGCENNGYRALHFPVVPQELADCKFYRVVNKEGALMNVVRCPNSTTSTSYASGKTTAHVTTIDGGVPPPPRPPITAAAQPAPAGASQAKEVSQGSSVPTHIAPLAPGVPVEPTANSRDPSSQGEQPADLGWR